MHRFSLSASLIMMIVIASLTFVGCGGERKAVKIDGSSTVAPISKRMLAEYRNVADDVQVSVGTSGTGGGFNYFCAGETHINDASRPITTEEIKLAKKNNVEFIELPVAFDGLTIAVSKDNSFIDDLTVAQLSKIFSNNDAKNWSDINSDWPNQPIRIYAPGQASGTFDYFIEAVLGKGDDAPTFRSGEGVSINEKDEPLVLGVAGDEFAIGFFGFAYYDNNRDKLKAVKVNGVGPSKDTIADGTYTPLSRPLFVYVSKKAASQQHIGKFIDFYLSKAPDLVGDVGYVALPDDVYAIIRNRFAKRITGSPYNGEGNKPGVSLTELYSE